MADISVYSVAQSYLNLQDPMGCNLSGSSVHGIFQARILEWVVISSFRGIFLNQGSNLHFLHWQPIGFFTTVPMARVDAFLSKFGLMV